MAELKVDTVKMHECSKEIMDLSNTINETLTKIFDRFDNICTKTHEWSGDSETEFVKRLDIEKIDYYEFKDEIYQYGRYLEDSINYLSNARSISSGMDIPNFSGRDVLIGLNSYLSNKEKEILYINQWINKCNVDYENMNEIDLEDLEKLKQVELHERTKIIIG